MSARRFALFAALAMFVMFVAANITANSWFRSWRLDLTENQLYSLSEGTQRTLDDLSEPVELTLYYSRDAAAPSPQLVAYAARVREMLQTFAARGHGRVRFVEIDVEAYSDEEDDAAGAGIQAVRPYEGADPIYFGLIGANAIDDQRIIPFLDPQREAFLEYDITRMIYELESPDPTRVALITSLPMDPEAAADPRAPPGGQSVFATQMGQLLNVTKLTSDFTAIPDDVDVLAIIHPGALSQRQLYAIDQFVLREGRLFLALDPASMLAMQPTGFDPFNPVAPIPPSSTLEPLLGRWGVTMTPGVVLDREGALDVSVQDPTTGQEGPMPQPLFFAVPADQFDRQDLMTAWLRRQINFGMAGGLRASERDGVEATPLVRTSGQTMRMSAQEAMMQPSPFDIMNRWPPSSGIVETIALRLSGNLETAFPEGAPAEEPAPVIEGEAPPPAVEAPAPEDPAEPLARSATPAEIVIVADTDFLEDNFYVDPRNGVTAADNASFALNAIDVLGGSDALVSLRSRAPSVRRMELLDEMEADVDRRVQRRTEELLQERQEAEAQLAELQARGRGSSSYAGNLGAELTPEENATIERYQARLNAVLDELRGNERTLRGDIDRLETIVVFINIWLAPLLIAAAGLFFFWRRQRRGRVRR